MKIAKRGRDTYIDRWCRVRAMRMLDTEQNQRVTQAVEAIRNGQWALGLEQLSRQIEELSQQTKTHEELSSLLFDLAYVLFASVTSTLKDSFRNS